MCPETSRTLRVCPIKENSSSPLTDKVWKGIRSRSAFEATTVFLGMTYFFEAKYDRAKELIDKAVMLTQRRRDVSFYDTSARSAKILLSSKINEITESEIDEFCELLIESSKVKQINRELYYASQSYLNLGNKNKADKYQKMCKEGLLKDSKKISISPL